VGDVTLTTPLKGQFIFRWIVGYLGCYFLSRSCKVDTTRCVDKFYGSFNIILNVLGKRRNDMLAVHLIKTYCLPMLLYSCEIWAARPVEKFSMLIEERALSLFSSIVPLYLPLCLCINVEFFKNGPQ